MFVTQPIAQTFRRSEFGLGARQFGLQTIADGREPFALVTP